MKALCLKIARWPGAIWVALYLLVACTPISSTNFDCTLSPVGDTQAKFNLPGFLNAVSPEPGSELDAQAYNDSLEAMSPHSSGIVVEIWMDEVDSLDDEVTSYMDEAAVLCVDEQVISNTNVKAADGLQIGEGYDSEGNVIIVPQGPLYLSWIPELGVGEHDVKFMIIKRSGQVFEYAWSFTITE